jgi:hypothetical protein
VEALIHFNVLSHIKGDTSKRHNCQNERRLLDSLFTMNDGYEATQEGQQPLINLGF